MTNQSARQPERHSPRVSVVLLTYNRVALLGKTIESILKQTWPDFELIIADNASADGTQQLCAQWAERDTRIRYIRRDSNVGMPQNVNLGLAESTGEYVAILHDDNIYRPDLLEKWTRSLEQHPGAAFVFNSYRILDVDGSTERVYREPLACCSPGSLLIEKIFFKRWRFDSPVCGLVMMRRKAFENYGPFDERFGIWSDVDLWLRLAEDFDVCYVDEPLIAIINRKLAPHQFEDSSSRVQRLTEAMFWEARMRHFRDRPLRRIGEAIRHFGFALAARSFNTAIQVKHRLTV